MRWRSTHNLLVAAVLLAAASGFALVARGLRIPAGWHVAASLPAVPLAIWLGWLGGRRWVAWGRRPQFAAALNAWTSRVVLGVLLVALATGAWAAWVEHPRAIIRARMLHRLASEALVPALAVHAALGLWLRGVRAAARRAAERRPEGGP